MCGSPLITFTLSDGIKSRAMKGAPDTRWHIRQWQMPLSKAPALRIELRHTDSRPLESFAQALHAPLAFSLNASRRSGVGPREQTAAAVSKPTPCHPLLGHPSSTPID
jgi:hypothetical protein